jgi:hypothetical protein
MHQIPHALEIEKCDELVYATRPKRNKLELEKQYMFVCLFFCLSFCLFVCNINNNISIEGHLEWAFGDDTLSQVDLRVDH